MTETPGSLLSSERFVALGGKERSDRATPEERNIESRRPFSTAVHKKPALIMREHIPGPGETLMLKLRYYARDRPRTRLLGTQEVGERARTRT